MNTPLHFPIDDKTIYQMGLNHGASHSTANYVPKTNSTAVLTNQLLEMLNQPPTNDDTATVLNNLIGPVYRKTDEILQKLDQLSSVVTNFIENQQAINEFLFDKLCKESHQASSNQSPEKSDEQSSFEGRGPLLSDESHQALDGLMEQVSQPLANAAIAQVPAVSASSTESTSDLPPLVDKMSVRDFLKCNLSVIKRDNEAAGSGEGGGDETTSMEEFNKFRVRNPPKKYRKSDSSTYSGAGSSGSSLFAGPSASSNSGFPVSGTSGNSGFSAPSASSSSAFSDPNASNNTRFSGPSTSSSSGFSGSGTSGNSGFCAPGASSAFSDPSATNNAGFSGPNTSSSSGFPGPNTSCSSGFAVPGASLNSGFTGPGSSSTSGFSVAGLSSSSGFSGSSTSDSSGRPIHLEPEERSRRRSDSSSAHTLTHLLLDQPQEVLDFGHSSNFAPTHHIAVPSAQRVHEPIDILMQQHMYPGQNLYSLNPQPTLQPQQAHVQLVPNEFNRFQHDVMENVWKTTSSEAQGSSNTQPIANDTQITVDPTQNNFLHFMGNEAHEKSAFVPTHFQKDRPPQ